MRTRKNPRKNINLPGRYFTGLGTPVDVALTDVSDGGCRFDAGAQKLKIGSPLQIYVAGSGPHRAVVRWVDDGKVGVTFARQLSDAELDALQSSHVPDLSDAAKPGEFKAMNSTKPHRFC